MNSYAFYVPVLRKAFCFPCKLPVYLQQQSKIALFYTLSRLGFQEKHFVSTEVCIKYISEVEGVTGRKTKKQRIKITHTDIHIVNTSHCLLTICICFSDTTTTLYLLFTFPCDLKTSPNKWL